MTAKAPTTPADQSEGVMAAIEAVLERAGAEAADVELFAHGMTVATNALLEGSGARTVLVATEGFTDVVELGRQARADLYRLCAARPAPLVAPELRVAAPERTGPDGVLRALEDPAALADEVAGHDPEAVAVVLLHAYAHPGHERAIAGALAERLPDVHVSLSHEVVGTFREYERAATTEVDAALSPLLARYLRRLLERARDGGPARAADHAVQRRPRRRGTRRPPRRLHGPVGSRPAARRRRRSSRATAAARTSSASTWAARRATSASSRAAPCARRPVARSAGARWRCRWSTSTPSARAAARSPGATRAARCASARAARAPSPGPACYGRGGEEPTVTDANLLLGRLDAGGALAGGVALDRAAAERAVGALAERLDLEPLACAEGIVRVANAEMVRALRVMTVQQGIDPRGFALLAFGGAGPLHAAAIAEELGMRTILCPRASGVLSALGLAAAERRATEQRTVLLAGDALTDEALADAGAEAGDGARATLGGEDARVGVAYDVRYRGQAHELTIRDLAPTPASSGCARRSRSCTRSATATATTTRRSRSSRSAPPRASPGRSSTSPRRRRSSGAASTRSRREVVFDGERHDAEILRGEPAPGERIAGPAICELPEATLAVPPGWRGSVDDAGTIVLERRAMSLDPIDAAGRHAARCAPPARRWARRSCAARTRRTSRSAATARRRCSTRPARWSCRPSTSPSTSARCRPPSPPCSTRTMPRAGPWILNDPYRGGTHLPDITVVTPSCTTARCSASPPAARTTPTSAAASPARCPPTRRRSTRRAS